MTIVNVIREPLKTHQLLRIFLHVSSPYFYIDFRENHYVTIDIHSCICYNKTIISNGLMFLTATTI